MPTALLPIVKKTDSPLGRTDRMLHPDSQQNRLLVP